MLLAGIIHYKHPMKRIIEYFCHRHVLVNLITAFVLIGGVIALDRMDREELPDITFNVVRISTNYLGASAADIEYFITRPIEEALDGMDGIKKIESISSRGQSSISVELDVIDSEINGLVDDIRNQVSSVDLPADLKRKPSVRVFETSKKAIVDIAIYDRTSHLLTSSKRSKLQSMANALKKQLLQHPDIFDARESGTLSETLTIQVDPLKLTTYDIDLAQIANEIKRHHVRTPAGQLNNERLEQVNVNIELDTPQKLQSLVVQGGFDSVPIRLGQLATIKQTFDKASSITKVNGHEAVVFNVIKNKSSGILKSLASVDTVVKRFESTTLLNTPYTITFMDDESIGLRNRLGIVGSNGMVGIALIFLLLMAFLNKRAGFWVALGIPFSLSVTIIITYFLGYSINVVTLSAIIIVLGIVVDDAIIVAENISKKMRLGMPIKEAATIGALEVLPPILASIITTCIAFLPLLFFGGRFGSFVSFLAPVIFLMLGASLIESFFILPSHMTIGKTPNNKRQQWFDRFEARYQHGLKYLLHRRYFIIFGFIALFLASIWLGASQLKFVLFPNVESREIVISGQVKSAKTKEETADKIRSLENYLGKYLGKECLNFQTNIARSRRGQASTPNQFRITLEITPKNKRKLSIDAIIDDIKTYTKTQPDLTKITFRKRRWGQSSGSIYEIMIKDNDDANRGAIMALLEEQLATVAGIENIERDEVLTSTSYNVIYNQEELKRLGVSPAKIAQTMRMILSGERLYSLIKNDVEVDVLLSVLPSYQTKIDQVLSIPISNQQGYMVPLKLLAQPIESVSKQSIRREGLTRTSFIYADHEKGTRQSPLDVATQIETTIFPQILADYPTAQLLFDGEIVDTQSSKQQLLVNVIMVIGLIYGVLAILFNSFFKPLRVILIIPFGIIGVILAFVLHQKTQIGFYACIGTIGMIGVVINDGIVMLDRLDQSNNEQIIETIPSIAASRLRAIVLTTLTTVIGVFPTAYGILGYDPMLGDMMLALAWGLVFGTLITLVLVPCMVGVELDIKRQLSKLNAPISLLVIGIGVFLSQPCVAKTPISLPDFLERASKNDPIFHQILTASYQQAYAKDIQIAFNDLQLSATRTTVGLSAIVPEIGQQYDIAYSDTSDTTTFKFSQDIARNAFGYQHRLDNRLQNMKDEIAIFEYIESYESYFSALTTLYYNWIRQYKSIGFAQSAVNENKKALASVIARQKKRIADDTDVAKLNLQVLAKEETLLQMQQTFQETSRLIVRAIGAPGEQYIPDELFELSPLPKSEAIILDQYNHSRSKRMFDLIKAKTHLDYHRVLIDTFPNIFITSEVTRSTETTSTVGFSYVQSLKNNTANARKLSQQLEIKKQDATQSAADTTQQVRIQNLYSHLRYLKQRIAMAEKKVKMTELIFKNETANYALGKINLNDFIMAVNRRDSSHFDLLEQRIAYQLQWVELNQLTDQLVKTMPEL